MYLKTFVLLIFNLVLIIVYPSKRIYSFQRAGRQLKGQISLPLASTESCLFCLMQSWTRKMQFAFAR